MDIQKGEHVGGFSTRNDNDARAAVAHDFLQKECHSWIGISLVPLSTEGRQRTVVIEQQCRSRRMGDGSKKWCDLRLNFRSQRCLPFTEFTLKICSTRVRMRHGHEISRLYFFRRIQTDITQLR